MRTKTENDTERKALMNALMEVDLKDEAAFMDLCRKRAAVLLKVYTENYRWENQGSLGLSIPSHTYNPMQLPNGFKSTH